MKKISLLVIGLSLILLCGCATPSEKILTKTTYFREDSTVWKIENTEHTKYDNSTFYSVRVYGVDIGVDMDTKIPRFRGGIIKYESARTSKGQKYDSDFDLDDVSWWNFGGQVKQSIKITDVDKEQNKDKKKDKK